MIQPSSEAIRIPVPGMCRGSITSRSASQNGPNPAARMAGTDGPAAARDSFITEVVQPALASAGPGRERLLALSEGYLSYIERRVFPGGCFFVAASAEVGAQAGRVHDEVARIQQQWRDLLAAEARAAVGQRELPDGTDAAQLAFELGVILAGTDIVSVLHDDLHAISRARTAIRARLTR